MSIISLKKYWQARQDGEADLLRLVHLLVEAISAHAVYADRADLEKFQADVEELWRALGEDPTVANVTFAAGGVLRAMEDYNRRTQQLIRAQGAELQNIVEMLTGTVARIARGSERSVARMREIEKQLGQTSEIEDIRVLRQELSECLTRLQEETDTQKEEASQAADELKRGIAQSQERMEAVRASSDVDPVTGLPGRTQAEQALREAGQSPARFYAAALVVERVQLISSRFGYAVGDEILQTFEAMLRDHLSAGDRVFRWRGPSLLLLLERPHSVEQVRHEMKKVAGARLEKTIEIGQRSVLLPVSATFAVFPVTAPVGLLIEQIDAFVATQIPREYA